MQVNVVNGGRSAFNAMLYNVPDTNTLGWLNNTINRASEVLSGIGDNILNTTVNLYNKVNNSAVINAAKSLIGEHGGNLNEHTIYGLDANTMCNANYVMQQYIMANPVVQNLYKDNLCHGFEETYFDQQPGSYGEDRYDYQRVMDGIVQEDKDGLYVMHYSNTDDVELTTLDKHIILDTWAQAEHMILCGMDPTDPDGGEL